MKLCKCVEDYAKQVSVTDLGLLKVCACSAGVIVGLFVPSKSKTTALATASFLFSLTLLPLMFKLVKVIANSR